jgi:hypothetical protein
MLLFLAIALGAAINGPPGTRVSIAAFFAASTPLLFLLASRAAK